MGIGVQTIRGSHLQPALTPGTAARPANYNKTLWTTASVSMRHGQELVKKDSVKAYMSQNI